MATNITFIIGNGLDISLGLETKYSQFYKYVENTKLETTNRIYNEIRADLETWADFESALGEYTNYIEKLPESKRQDESEKFHEELDEIRDDLADYLAIQEERIDALPNKFGFNAQGFFEELPIGQKDRIHRLLSSGAINVNFVTLNYTTSLEKILSNAATLNATGWRRGTLLHIHGDLFEDLTLGVSNESQLYAGMSPEEKNDLIKPTLIESMNDGRLGELSSIINNSSIIVLFGTSIGETDDYIWQHITEWLDTSQGRLAIVHIHDDNYRDTIKRSSRKRKYFIKTVQDNLLKHTELDPEDMEVLKEQVFVIHNTKKLFYPKQN